MIYPIVWSHTQWIHRSPESLKTLILNVKDYPSFVPGCHSLNILTQDENTMLCRMKTNYGVSFDSHIQWKENSILITSDPILKAFWTLQEQGLGTLITFEMTLTPSAIGQAFLLRKGIPWLAPSILQAFLEKATLSHV